MNEQIYLAIVDKLEKPDSPLNDLLIEAVGNDDGTLRDAIYRIAAGGNKELLNAFAKYFDAGKIEEQINQKNHNDLCTDLLEAGVYQNLTKDWENA
jgi:hypothetical protein